MTQVEREIKCYGMTQEDARKEFQALKAFYNSDKMIYASVLSDCQEAILHGDGERARQWLNKVKYWMFEVA